MSKPEHYETAAEDRVPFLSKTAYGFGSLVNNILGQFADCPVIFITAFPERLLTGEGPEPAFLITKPYNEAQVRTAVSQAMFLQE